MGLGKKRSDTKVKKSKETKKSKGMLFRKKDEHKANVEKPLQAEQKPEIMQEHVENILEEKRKNGKVEKKFIHRKKEKRIKEKAPKKDGKQKGNLLKLGKRRKKKQKIQRQKVALHSPKDIIKLIKIRMAEREANTEYQRVEKVKWYHGIQLKLYSLIVIPILFLVILGMVSYSKASSGIKNTYVESVSSSIELTTSYYDFVFGTIKTDYNALFVDSKLRNYVNGGYSELSTVEGMSYYNEKYKEFNYDVTDNKFLNNVYLLTDAAASITTTNSGEDNLYSVLLKTEQGKLASQDNTKYYYFGTIPEVDEALHTSQDQYAIRIIRQVPKAEGCLVLDLSRAQMQEILGQLEVGDGCISAFVTGDGYEVYGEGIEEKEGTTYFSGQKYFEKAMESEEKSFQKEVQYKGTSYLFLMSKVGDTEAAVCCLIPIATINQQASGIRNVTVVLLIVSIIISALLGLVIAQGMSHTISNIMKQIKKVSNGDLTVKICTRRKDEFAALATGISDMIAHTKHLIQQVEGVTSELTGISEDVIRNSQEFLSSSKSIEQSVEEIEVGTTNQAEHSVDCLEEMDTLSNRIQVVNTNTHKISDIASDTETSIRTGMESMTVLSEKSHSTAEITNVVIESIEKLEKQSKSIGQIVGVINEIASETNLLSLNASIEAARAGEAGRGFSVVATEIRKLADQSMASAEEIQKIIEEIVKTTKNAANTAKEADNIVHEQQEAVDHTTDAFRSMESQVNVLMSELESILAGVQEMEKTRSATLSAIEEISAVSEQTAASVTDVNSMIGKQLQGVEELSQNSERLSTSAEELGKAVNQFTIR